MQWLFIALNSCYKCHFYKMNARRKTRSLFLCPLIKAHHPYEQLRIVSYSVDFFPLLL